MCQFTDNSSIPFIAQNIGHKIQCDILFVIARVIFVNALCNGSLLICIVIYTHFHLSITIAQIYSGPLHWHW
jgi:hypothetical protein